MKAVNHLTKAGNTDIIELSREEAKSLRANAEIKVIRPATENGFTEIQPIGFSRISSTPRVVTGGDSSDWIILPANKDPLYQQGQLAAPKEVREPLMDMLNAGVWFDSISIAHQVPKGALAKVRNKADLQRLVEPPTPRSLTFLSNLIRGTTSISLKGAETSSKLIGKGVEKGGEGLGLAALGIALAGAAMVAALAAIPARAAVDPIIFGAVVAEPPAKEGDPALFFVVARWDY